MVREAGTSSTPVMTFSKEEGLPLGLVQTARTGRDGGKQRNRHQRADVWTEEMNMEYEYEYEYEWKRGQRVGFIIYPFRSETSPITVYFRS